MLQTLSELNFIPSVQPDYKEYRKYFKILDINTDTSFNIGVLRSSYQKLKALFSQTPSNALYSLDSMSSFVVELDEAYKNLYQYLSLIHKNMNSSMNTPSSTNPNPTNNDYDFPFSGRVEESTFEFKDQNFQSNIINSIPEYNTQHLTNTTVNTLETSASETNTSNLINDSIPSYIEGASASVCASTNELSNNTQYSNIPTSTSTSTSTSINSSIPSTQDLNLLSILENSDLRLGSTYKYIRESLQISLEEIQDKTKISTYYLNSIETNNFRNFQALIFLKGFFKAYLKCLKIPKQEECLNIYINNAKMELSKNR